LIIYGSKLLDVEQQVIIFLLIIYGSKLIDVEQR